MLDYLTYILAFAAMALSLWAVIGWFSGAERLNMQWKTALKAGDVPPQLRRYYRKYPDKLRFVLFWLQAQRLKQLSAAGVVAELGVYKGETAKLLQLLMPERDLFLFDTFKGFNQSDLETESGEALSYTTAHFAGTSPAMVRELLEMKENVSFFVGDFAAVIPDIPERKYALVSIDADLGKPTKDGLAYFYPRLMPGAAIIIHDYHPKWPELMKAVDEFLQKIPETAVAIPDTNNSMVIVKNKL